MWSCQWIQLLIVKRGMERCAGMVLLRGRVTGTPVGGMNAGVSGWDKRTLLLREEEGKRVKVRERERESEK